MTEATSVLLPDGDLPPPLRMLRVDPPVSVIKAMGDLRLECGSWRPVEVRPGDVPHALATATSEAAICDQISGDRDPVGEAQFFGVVQGVALAVLAIGAYRLMDAFVRGICDIVGRRFGMGRGHAAQSGPNPAAGGSHKD